LGGYLDITCWTNQQMVLDWLNLGQLIPVNEAMRMVTIFKKRPRQLNSQAGITMIETLMAAAILAIGSLGMMGLVVGSIATNNRNKIDSSQTLLAEAILEQVNSTFNGTGTSALTDCVGTTWTINTVTTTATIPPTTSWGANLSGASIDWTQTSPPAGYAMNYTVTSKCPGSVLSSDAVEGVYDVRWHLDQIYNSATTPVTYTNTYMLTVGAKLKNHGNGNLFFSLPVTLRVLSGA
jgi:Tfp pilus assembly protein PilV